MTYSNVPKPGLFAISNLVTTHNTNLKNVTLYMLTDDGMVLEYEHELLYVIMLNIYTVQQQYAYIRPSQQAQA